MVASILIGLTPRTKMFKDFIPPSSLKLVKYSGAQIIDRLGKEIISNVVASVLSGENIRNLTEGLTQRRLLLMNSGLFITFLKALSSYDNFTEQMTSVIEKELSTAKKTRTKSEKLTQDERQFLLWFLGLTLKSVDNVTRGDTGMAEYLKELDRNLSGIAQTVEKQFGKLEINIKLQNEKYHLKWPALLRCMLAMGAQTLTIRGSEKSIYGKLFEKFVLGSAITLLGGSYIHKDDTSKDTMVFWLSSSMNDRRESDATFLLRPGIGISFDIGFIGKGNPEAPMDKLTRYDNLLQRGRRRNVMTTFVLIDSIGKDSRAKDIAEETGGFIIQMSGSYWIKELAEDIHSVYGVFDSPLLHMTNEESLEYIRKEVPKIDLAKFLSPADIEEFSS